MTDKQQIDVVLDFWPMSEQEMNVKVMFYHVSYCRYICRWQTTIIDLFRWTCGYAVNN